MTDFDKDKQIQALQNALANCEQMLPHVTEGRWVLFISPWEAATAEWEAMVFDSEDTLLAEKWRRDLTKEHYWLRVADVVELIQEKCKREEGTQPQRGK